MISVAPLSSRSKQEAPEKQDLDLKAILELEMQNIEEPKVELLGKNKSTIENKHSQLTTKTPEHKKNMSMRQAPMTASLLRSETSRVNSHGNEMASNLSWDMALNREQSVCRVDAISNNDLRGRGVNALIKENE